MATGSDPKEGAFRSASLNETLEDGAPADLGEPDEAAVAEFRSARERVLATIADACARVGRDPSQVMLVAVSKTVPPARLIPAVSAGLDLLGENRVQEAAAKVPLVPRARWHLVGPLQSNKARRAVELFEAIHSVDSVAIAERLDRLVRELRGLPSEGPVPTDRQLPVYLQVNVDEDPRKAGFREAELEASLDALTGLEALELAGLMTVGRLVASAEGARPTFQELRRTSDRLRSRWPALGSGLSMGMSEDYPIAVEEGATVVRVGRALFGERPPAH